MLFSSFDMENTKVIGPQKKNVSLSATAKKKPPRIEPVKARHKPFNGTIRHAKIPPVYGGILT